MGNESLNRADGAGTSAAPSVSSGQRAAQREAAAGAAAPETWADTGLRSLTRTPMNGNMKPTNLWSQNHSFKYMTLCNDN